MIKLLILDVDGTLTDGSIYIGDHGEEFKRFNCRDGLAILFLRQIKIIPIIITARESRIVLNRAAELGITEVYQNQKNKDCLLAEICQKYHADFSEVAYIGDDLNDLRSMKKCRLRMCPKDAHPEIQASSDYVSAFSGGRGAVRDCLEYLFRETGNYEHFIRYYN